MSIKDLKYLKELSWYTTVPLFVCAWIMQDFIVIQSELTSVLGFVKIVSIYFAKVVIGLLFAFVIWLIAAVNLDKVSFPFTLLLATFLLTLAGTGLAIYIIKPGHLNLPVNILWFAALASVAFNLYEIQKSALQNASADH